MTCGESRVAMVTYKADIKPVNMQKLVCVRVYACNCNHV